MAELLKIKKFCGITNAEFTVKDFNILIGEQSVGKSISLKLLYYFKSFFAVDSECYASKKDFLKKIEKIFFDMFKCDDCNATEIHYFFSDWTSCKKHDDSIDLEKYYSITLTENQKFNISFSKELEKIINEFFSEIEAYEQNEIKKIDQFPVFYKSVLQKKMPALSKFWQLYIPADRNVISKTEIGSSVYSNNNGFDFFEKFVTFIKNNSRLFFSQQTILNGKLPVQLFEKYFFCILKGNINLSHNEQTKNFEFSIKSEDGRNIELKNASSGQQSATPLLIALLGFIHFDYDVTFPVKKILYIEEPEAHLFPTSQKTLLDIFALISTGKYPINVNLTTHSPYILSYTNNILKKGKLKQLGLLDTLQSNGKIFYIDNNTFSSYYLKFDNKKFKLSSIFNTETGLIDENAISGVLDTINDEFDKILDIEYGSKDDEC